MSSDGARQGDRKMRKSLWFIPVLLLFEAIGAPIAHADRYTVTSGGFTAAPDIEWNGGVVPPIYWGLRVVDQSLVFTLSPAGAPLSLAGDFVMEPAIGFTERVFTGFFPHENFYWQSGPLDSLQIEYYDGNFIDITFTDVPEPGTAALLLTGMGLVFVTRKRISQLL